MVKLEKAVKAILHAKKIVIACHRNPDGDCIGSLLALGLGLSVLGKQVDMVSQDGVPKRYKELPGADKIKKRISQIPDMAITVDCNAPDMVGRPFKAIIKASQLLEIDHHEYRRPFGTLALIDTKAAAVGEIVYMLLKGLGVSITRAMAQNILTSVIVETNSFRLPAVRPLTFIICAGLLKTGLDFSRLSELIYWSKTKEAVLLLGLCARNLKFANQGEIAWSVITKKDFSSIAGKPEDADSIPDDILCIKTVKIALLFREAGAGMLRVSLRSKGGINIASLADRYGGGGHFDSAGCHIADKKGAIAGFIAGAKELLAKAGGKSLTKQ